MIEIDGIAYEDEDLERYDDGSAKEGILASDCPIQGLPCAGSEAVVFYPSGSVRLATLSRPATISGINCAAAIVYLHENGRLASAEIASDTSFGPTTSVAAGQRITLDDACQLLEYSRLHSHDAAIDGLTCCRWFRTWHYADGRTSVIVLATPAAIDGVTYPRGTELFLDRDGSVLESESADVESGPIYRQRVFGVIEYSYD